jgi:hypothetical protein
LFSKLSDDRATGFEIFGTAFFQPCTKGFLIGIEDQIKLFEPTYEGDIHLPHHHRSLLFKALDRS